MRSCWSAVHCFTGRSMRVLPSDSRWCTNQLPGAIPCRSMELDVRNMVCDRCQTAVQRNDLGEEELLLEVPDSER